MKTTLIAVTGLTVLCGAALAQTTTGPAPQGDNMNKPGMSKGTIHKGSMKKKTGTTGSAMKPGASQQGAPTGASVNASGTSAEPGKVNESKTR